MDYQWIILYLLINGIVFLIYGLDKLLQETLKIPVMIAEDAQSCVAIGTGKALDNLDTLDGRARK